MRRKDCMKWTGIALIGIGLILIFTWDILYDHMLNKQMDLSPGSKAFEMWKDPSVPIVMNVYLFNCTNPEQLHQKNFKPHFVQMGPYSFKEVHEKVDITWNDNGTVTYKQIKRWYFDPENSNGTLADNVTMLNVLPVAATYVSRHWSNFLVYPLSAALRVVEKTLWITKPVGQHLFDGYTDPLLTIANQLPGFASMQLPADKIGFFYGRNGSADFEGTFNMDTGSLGLSNLGVLRNWNFRDTSQLYQDECSELKGSAGDFFPTKLTRDKEWAMFAPDICKSVTFEYLEDTEVSGISGFRYVPTGKLFDNGSVFPEAECNCGGDCLPSGVLNVSLCRHGAPGFVSYPHFLGADPYYLNSVSGLNPNPDLHAFQVTVEPRTGIPLDVTARLQINLLLQPFERISLMRDVPFLMSPMMWFEDKATLPPELASTLKLVLGLSAAGRYFSICLLLLGVLLLAAVFLPFFCRRENQSLKKRSSIIEVVFSNLDTSPKKDRKSEEDNKLLQKEIYDLVVK